MLLLLLLCEKNPKAKGLSVKLHIEKGLIGKGGQIWKTSCGITGGDVVFRRQKPHLLFSGGPLLDHHHLFLHCRSNTNTPTATTTTTTTTKWCGNSKTDSKRLVSEVLPWKSL
ncbi:unnamed protein product [Camellia sinensis]